jgi:hypothetical protein
VNSSYPVDEPPALDDLFQAILDAPDEPSTTRLAGQAIRYSLSDSLGERLIQAVRSGTPLLGPGGILSGRLNSAQRLNALIALIAIGPVLRVDVDIRQPIRQIWGKDDTIRPYAMRATTAIASGMAPDSPEVERAVRALSAALRHRDPTIRLLAAHSLGELGATRALDSLAARLEEETDPEVRDAVALTVGMLRRRDGVIALLDAYEKGSITYEVCLDALVELGEDAISTLISLVKRWNVPFTSREVAAGALGLLRAEAALESLLVILEREHEPDDIRIAAAYAIGRIGTPELILLLESLKKKRKTSRELKDALAYAIGRVSEG